jgi:hypothetical protein
MTGLETDVCFLGGDSGFGYQMAFISGPSVNMTVNASTMAEIRDLKFEITREMIPDWNGSEAKLALKKSLVVVYNSRWDVVNLTKFLIPLIGNFLIRKVSEVRYRNSQIGSRIKLREIPTFLVTDKEKTKIGIAWEGSITILNNLTDRATGAVGNGLSFRPEIGFEKVQQIDWFWIVFALSNSLVVVIVLWLSRGV